MDPDPNTAAIAELNDRFRQGLSGRRYITRGIAALPIADQAEIVRRVMTYEAFTPDNDPYNEHDFGSFTHAGRTIFWKIDAYDTELRYGSDDPADPARTTRVLTIMLAEEY